MRGRSRTPSSRATSAAIAGGLRGRLGLARGRRVGIAMENCGEYLQVLYGIWRAGMVAVPMNVKLHEKEIAFILDNAGCEACFCTPDVADRLAPLDIFKPGNPASLDAARRDYAASARVRPDRRGVQRGRRTRPGCSTPAGPPAVPRGPCSPSATCSSCRTATTPTSIISTIAT